MVTLDQGLWMKSVFLRTRIKDSQISAQPEFHLKNGTCRLEIHEPKDLNFLKDGSFLFLFHEILDPGIRAHSFSHPKDDRDELGHPTIFRFLCQFSLLGAS
jgi:hypothetical protein